MRKTYAYNSVIIGALLGILVWAETESTVLGVLACIMISIIGFIVIQLLENTLYAASDKAADAVGDAVRRHRQKHRH